MKNEKRSVSEIDLEKLEIDEQDMLFLKKFINSQIFVNFYEGLN
jgi:hypothetical protein